MVENFAIYILRTVVSFWHEILSNAPRFTIYKFSSLERDFFKKKMTPVDYSAITFNQHTKQTQPFN